MRILHAADLHIDSPLRGLTRYDGAPAEEMKLATRRATENLVQAAVDHTVDLVVIAGDVFDGDWKDYGTGLFWTRQLGKLRDHGIPVVIVAGNHDAASDFSRRLTLPDNVTQLSTSDPEAKRFDHLDLVVVGQGYGARSMPNDLAAGFPLADPGLFTLGLVHTSLDGRPGHATYAPTSLDTLRGRGYQYWALGHVHKREVVLEDPWVVFPGNVQGRHAQETGPKGASLITVEHSEVQSVEHLPLDVARWADCAVDTSGANDLDSLLALVGSRLDQEVAEADGRLVAARVRLVGASPIHEVLWSDTDRVEAEVRSLGVLRSDVWVEKVKIETHREGEVDSELIAGITAQVAAMKASVDELAVLDGMFTDLRNKIPAELRFDEGLGDGERVLASPLHIEASLDAALDLVAALLSEGGLA